MKQTIVDLSRLVTELTGRSVESISSLTRKDWGYITREASSVGPDIILVGDIEIPLSKDIGDLQLIHVGPDLQEALKYTYQGSTAGGQIVIEDAIFSRVNVDNSYDGYVVFTGREFRLKPLSEVHTLEGGELLTDGWTAGAVSGVPGYIHSNPAKVAPMDIDLSLAGLEVGSYYRVSYSISVTSGSVEITLGDDLVSSGQPTGSYSRVIKYTGGDGRLTLSPSSFNGSVYGISIKELKKV